MHALLMYVILTVLPNNIKNVFVLSVDTCVALFELSHALGSAFLISCLICVYLRRIPHAVTITDRCTL
jgi:hypothetical protein